MLRNKKKFVVDGESYWIRELNVGDVFDLYYAFQFLDAENVGDLFSTILENKSLVESISTCPCDVLMGLGSSELKDIYKLFLDLNGRFFRTKTHHEDSKVGNSVSFIDNMFFRYCSLVESGHVDALQYGYSFFLKAVNNHEKLKCSKTADLAFAVRMANHGKDKDWKKYMRRLVG